MHFAVTITTALAIGLASAQTTAEITVRADVKHQYIDGFGFSGAFQRAQLLLNVTDEVQQELFDLLYSTKTGIGFSILRNGIGSSNSSYNDWMNTILPVSPGSPDGEFNYTWDRYDSGQLELARKAVEYGVERIYGNAWSAPGFMKTNQDDANGGLLCGVPGSEDDCEHDWRRAYADYLVQYLNFYKDEGINVTDIAWLNEPDYTTSYASMRSNVEQTADFLPILSQALEDADYDVGIICCEATGWDVTREMVAGLQGLDAEKYIKTWTSHEYTSRIDEPLKTDLNVWQSEYCDLSGSWTTAWDSGISNGDGWYWADVLHHALAVGNVNAYIWWLAVQDEATNNNNNEKLIMVEDGEYTVAKRAWSFAHYARYIRPGAYRVVSEGGDELKTTAYENEDGSVVVVILNPEHERITVTLSLVGGRHKRETVQAWVTDDEHEIEEVEVTVGDGGNISAKLPARALITIKAS